MKLEKLLVDFPRQRPTLPPAYREVYVGEYKSCRTGRNFIQQLSQKAESWMHRQVAFNGVGGDVLEIGAGPLNHLPYENASLYDVVEPFTELYEDSAIKSQVRYFFDDITQVPQHEKYDRVLSVAVLEHLEDLPLTLALSGLLLRDGGRFQAGIPSEGGFLWGLGWRCTTGLSYRMRTGLSYKTCMMHEHINSAREIIALVRYFFRDVSVSRFPFPVHHLSLYAYLDAGNPDRALCQNYSCDRSLDCSGIR